MIRMKIAAVMMIPLTICGSVACAQESQPNCVATATVPSQLKPQISSELQPQENYGTYVPYTGPPLKPTSSQSGATDVTSPACSTASTQTPTPSTQIPPPPPPKLQEEAVHGSSVTDTAPAPKAAPSQVAVNEVPSASCSTVKLQDDPIYASYVPYTGPLVRVGPASCFTPGAQSLHNSSAPAAVSLQLVSSEPMITSEAPVSMSEAPHDPAPPSGAARPPVDDTPINPSPIVGEPASTSEFVRLAPPRSQLKSPIGSDRFAPSR